LLLKTAEEELRRMYVKATKTPSLIALLLQGVIISTKPATPYPVFEERMDYGQEKAVPSASPFHQISSIRGWLILRATPSRRRKT